MKKKVLIKYKDVDIYQGDNLVLKNVMLEVAAGEFVYLIGKVGTGKSSFLKSLYHDATIADGSAKVLDYDMRVIKVSEIPFLRRKIGIVFQDFQLLIDRSVNENLEFVLRATGWKDKVAISEQIEDVLSQVGMRYKGHKMPHQLSGGEQQRVVIARALLNSPEMILADEPTGNLDPETGNELVDLLYNIRLSGTTVIMATHNLTWLENYPGRVFRFENEKISEDQSILSKTKETAPVIVNVPKDAFSEIQSKIASIENTNTVEIENEDPIAPKNEE
jgi:cell division transport system ATP-binding protein